MTELVLSSSFQKSGTLTACFSSDIFGAGAFFCDGIGSFTATNTCVRAESVLLIASLSNCARMA